MKNANRNAEKASTISLIVNVLLSFIKIVTGLLGSSYALIADGIESLADTASSLIVWNGLRFGSKEPDKDHPYGHGKAEAIATLIAGLGLLLSAAMIAWQAVSEIMHDHAQPALFTAPVLAAIIIIKEALFRYMRRQAKRYDSNALMAEAWHHRSDSLTSLCVFVGLCVAIFAGPSFAKADDIAALLVTVLIVRNGYLIIKPAINELMDRRILGERYDRILKTIMDTPGVIEVETLWIRRSGRQYHVDIHIEVDPEITVREGHAISHEVKDRLLALSNLQIEYVGTHIEPAETAAPPPEEF